jgi:hypothetical protein
MIMKWESLKATLPGYEQIIQEGLDKIEAYRNHTDLAPAYTLAMGTSSALFRQTLYLAIPYSCRSCSQVRLV